MRDVSKIMEFTKNNLAILIAIISSCFNFYQYFENKKLKKYSTEKNLKQKQASLEKLYNDYKNYKANNLGLPIIGEKEKKENEFKHRKKCLIAEIECLKKILKARK